MSALLLAVSACYEGFIWTGDIETGNPLIPGSCVSRWQWRQPLVSFWAPAHNDMIFHINYVQDGAPQNEHVARLLYSTIVESNQTRHFCLSPSTKVALEPLIRRFVVATNYLYAENYYWGSKKRRFLRTAFIDVASADELPSELLDDLLTGPAFIPPEACALTNLEVGLFVTGLPELIAKDPQWALQVLYELHALYFGVRNVRIFVVTPQTNGTNWLAPFTIGFHNSLEPNTPMLDRLVRSFSCV